jgi:hypothetical protein
VHVGIVVRRHLENHPTKANVVDSRDRIVHHADAQFVVGNHCGDERTVVLIRSAGSVRSVTA